MKKAFTLLELVFVIVVIGILSATVIPTTKENILRKAATQLVAHIRYTQHLAIIDDKFNTLDPIWFEKRWRLKFSNGLGTNNKYSYTIFDDRDGAATGNPDPDEIAVNPLDRRKKLTGGAATVSNTVINTNDKNATKEMNLGLEYGILDVDFSATCRTANNNKLITFDALGRPIKGTTSDMNSSYQSATNASNILISEQCVIDLCSVSDCSVANAEEKISIAVEPETGYVHIL